MSGRRAEMVGDPEGLPKLVAHEAVHFQQPQPTGTITLQSQSIREGAADCIAELASGRAPDGAYLPYGLAHEAEFREVMHGATWPADSTPASPTDARPT